MLVKSSKISVITLLFSIIITTPSHAWLIYNKPTFKGKVIDAETKKPIDGAVVVVTYSKKAIRVAPELVSIIVDVKESLTDNDGIFYIPSFTTIIDPFSWSKEVTFIIFKPSYGSFPDWRVSPPKGMETHFEEFFSRDFGLEKEVWWSEPWKTGAESNKIKVTFGIVELPKLKTREERIKVNVSPIGEPSDWKKQKEFIKLIRQEWQYLYSEDPGDLYIYKK
jgi:hypothetical protein